MKHAHVLLAVVLLGAAASAPAAPATFEGKVRFEMNEGKKTVPLEYQIKGDRIRMDFTDEDGEGAGMVLDHAKGEMIMLMPSEEMYMVMKIDVAAAAEAAKGDAKVEKTGRTEKILGYDCDEYRITEKKNVTEMWAARGLGNFAAPSSARGGMGGKQAPAAWEQALKRDGLFPLRVIERDAKGKEKFRMEVKAIEPGKLPDSLFAPPAGWQKFEMPSMGGMFGG